MIEQTWYKNGRELVYFKKAQEWVKKVKQEFINQNEYRGFPMLPDCWLDIMKIYDGCPHEDEKRMIFNMMHTELTEALRHWKVDRDALYGRGEWEKFSYI
jgi:hypothetical protein